MHLLGVMPELLLISQQEKIDSPFATQASVGAIDAATRTSTRAATIGFMVELVLFVGSTCRCGGGFGRTSVVALSKYATFIPKIRVTVEIAGGHRFHGSREIWDNRSER